MARRMRFWFSRQQQEHIAAMAEQDIYWSKFEYSPFSWGDQRKTFVTFLQDGEPIKAEYTECCDVETHPDYTSGWDDAVLLGEFVDPKISFGPPLVSPERKRFILGIKQESSNG